MPRKIPHGTMDTPDAAPLQAASDHLLTKPAITAEPASPVSLTPEQITAALGPAKETHRLVTEWVRSLDFKVGPLLSAGGALLAASLAVLGQQTTIQALQTRPWTHLLLAFTLVPLLYSLMMAISANSPSLKWGRWGTNRHLPERIKAHPTSVIFFGQIAQHESSDAYAAAAKAAFLDDSVMLDDLLKQTYLNAKIAQLKSTHVALATRGLFIAVVLLLVCALTFLLRL